jgi:hypothetical protein
MSETQSLPEYYEGSGLYQIRLKGHLDDRWADRFNGLTIKLQEDGNTLLSGPVTDQAALHGLLKKCVIWECLWSRLLQSHPIAYQMRNHK